MDSNCNTNSKPDSKYIICKICHQPILESKMFLHEGFCSRNNIFCEHCNEVFLKEDYQDHIKYIGRSSTKINTNLPKKTQIFETPIITKRKATFEYIEMPMTEEIKVNNPIVISNGKIISTENKNDFLLPLIIKNIRKSSNGERINVDKEFFDNRSEYLFPTKLFSDVPTTTYFDNLNYRIDISNSMKNSISMRDLKINYDYINDNINYEFNNGQTIYDNHNSLYKNNSCFYNDFNNSKLKQIKLEKKNISPNNTNNTNNKLNKKKNNRIIINNNIITYNANNNINKIHNYFNGNDIEQEPIKSSMTNKINIDNINDNLGMNPPRTCNTIKFYSTRKSNKRDIYNFIRRFKRNLIQNKIFKFDNRQPYDNKSKNTFQNFHFTSYILEEVPQNENGEKKNCKPNDNKNVKKCQLCNCLVKDLTNHLQHYHSKEPTDIKKPKKRDTDILNDKLNDENMNEIGIDENKKKILRRTVNPISHKVGEINENLNEINLNSASIVEKKPFNKSGKNKKSNIIKLYDTSAKAKQKKKGNKKFNNNIRLNNANYINSDKKSPKNRKKLNLQNSADKKGEYVNSFNLYNDVGNKTGYYNEKIFTSPNINDLH